MVSCDPNLSWRKSAVGSECCLLLFQRFGWKFYRSFWNILFLPISWIRLLLEKIVQKPFPSFRPPPEGNIEAPSSHTSPVPHSRHLLIKHREEHCFEFSSPKFCSYPTQLLYVEDVRDLLQMLFIDLFRLKKTQTRGHVEFINSALKYLEEYGLHKDLDTYKAILNVFPKGAMIPRNTFQVGDFHHFF